MREEFTAAANWSFSNREGHPDWLAEKKVHLLLQLGLTKGTSPALHDVPLVMDVARNTEQRSVFQVLMGMKAMGRPISWRRACEGPRRRHSHGVPEDHAGSGVSRRGVEDLGSDPTRCQGSRCRRSSTTCMPLPADIHCQGRDAVKPPGATKLSGWLDSERGGRRIYRTQCDDDHSVLPQRT